VFQSIDTSGISTDTPLVSVVITTKNEEKNIRNCLKSIKLQTWPNIEVIVVDNNSTDRTQAVAAYYTDKVFTKGPERSAQRNFGMVEMAKGVYVIYIDADMILSPILIESCVGHMRKADAVALHVPEIVLGKNYFSRVRRFERSFYDGTSIDGARFFHRESFIRVGGFDERLFAKGSGEDWDIDKLMKQLGRIELLPRFAEKGFAEPWPMREFIEQRGVNHVVRYAGIYHNEAEFKLLPYLRKKSYYSLGFEGYVKKWGKDDPDIRRQFGLVYRFWTVFTENGKWKRLLARPNLAAGMYFLRGCVGFVFMLKKLGVADKVLPAR
jgi:glycosyltransferase involved in cell wall biosynthesis